MRRTAALMTIIFCFMLSFASFAKAERAEVGFRAPDFQAKAYFPKKNSFGKISLSKLLKKGKWVVLFFYPADFTFA